MAKKRCFLYFETEKNKVKVGPDNFLFPSPLHSVVGMKNATIKVRMGYSFKIHSLL